MKYQFPQLRSVVALIESVLWVYILVWFVAGEFDNPDNRESGLPIRSLIPEKIALYGLFLAGIWYAYLDFRNKSYVVGRFICGLLLALILVGRVVAFRGIYLVSADLVAMLIVFLQLLSLGMKAYRPLGKA